MVDATEDRPQVAPQIAADPRLRHFAAAFPDLLRGSDDIAVSFERLARSMATGRGSGAIQFSIRDGGEDRAWCLLLSPKGCDVAEERVLDPNLEVITDRSTWSEIAAGRLAPLVAFGSGRLRVRGEIRLAVLLAGRVSGNAPEQEG